MKQPHEKFPPDNLVVVDASVFLHFAFVQRLEVFLKWFNKKVCTTSIVKKEVMKVSNEKIGFGKDLDLQKYIDLGLITLEPMDSEEITVKYWGYRNQKFQQTIFHSGESSCLAVALVKQYGLVCDEKQVTEEFVRSKKFNGSAWSSKKIVELALREKFITKKEADEIYLGFKSQI